jgi:hypothetical protein
MDSHQNSWHHTAGDDASNDSGHDSLYQDSGHSNSSVDPSQADLHNSTSLFDTHGLFADFIHLGQGFENGFLLHNVPHEWLDDLISSDDSSHWHIISNNFPSEDAGASSFSLLAVGSEDHAHEISSHFHEHHVPARVSFSGSAGQINAGTSSLEDQGSLYSESAIGQSDLLNQGLINLLIAASPYDSDLISELNEFLSSRGIIGYISRVDERGIPKYTPLQNWLP